MIGMSITLAIANLSGLKSETPPSKQKLQALPAPLGPTAESG